MSTESASSRGRLLPSLLGILLLLMGLAMLAGGVKLSMLGGSLYYLLAGIGIALSGILMLMRRRAALGLYAIVLFASTVWALVGSRPGLVATGAAPGPVVCPRFRDVAAVVPSSAAARTARRRWALAA